MRIATLLPSATEIVCALGLAEDIVGITHECDFPLEIRTRPVIVRGKIDSARLSSATINAEVEGALARGESLYEIDLETLAAARPDLLITQDLCEVCALPGTDVEAALAYLPNRPEIVRLHPHTLSDILDDIVTVGSATGREVEARRVVTRLQERIARVEAVVRGRFRARVFCMEWLDPPFCAGHWMPEIVECAGGREVLGLAGRPSFQVEWSRIASVQPDVVVLVVCGFDLERTRQEAAGLAFRAAWQDLPAVRAGRVYATDSGSYFSRSGPRIVDGLEILAEILHPGAPPWPVPRGSWAQLASPAARPDETLHTRQAR